MLTPTPGECGEKNPDAQTGMAGARFGEEMLVSKSKPLLQLRNDLCSKPTESQFSFALVTLFTMRVKTMSKVKRVSS